MLKKVKLTKEEMKDFAEVFAYYNYGDEETGMIPFFPGYPDRTRFINYIVAMIRTANDYNAVYATSNKKEGINKKALLLSALEYGFEKISELSGISPTDLFGENLENALTAFEKIHTDYRNLHEELEGLRHTDEDVRKLYNEFTQEAIQDVYDRLPEDIKNKPHSFENLHIAIGIMEDYCHHYMNKDLSDRELEYMRCRTVELTEYLLKG